MRQLAAFLLFLLLLLSCTDGERMRQRLNDLQAANQADSLLTDDSLALALTDYFDRHGTPNEQMLAHYLLGRTYADMGEAPAALDAYHQAVECADTTSSDCDYYILSRVYAQMSSVFYQQNLMSDYMECLNYSIAAAERANDTIMALNEFAYKMEYYDRTNYPDSVIRIGEVVYQKFNLWGYKQIAAQYLGYTILSCLREGEYNKARRYMDVFECQSDLFDSCHQIAKGREIYYYSKGLYYLHIQQYDSAEYFFRKEIQEGKDFNNQNAASHGLALLFKNTHQSDSATKYALYSYDMNDSVYSYMSTRELEEMQALYNYNRHQRIASQEKEIAERARSYAHTLLAIIIGIGLVSLYIFLKLMKRRKNDMKRYQWLLEHLEKTQTELLRLQSHEQEWTNLISDKENELKHLQEQFLPYQPSANRSNRMVEDKLKRSSVYQKLIDKAPSGQKLSEKEWHDIHKLVIECLPEFHSFISGKSKQLGITAYRSCILLRLHLRVKDVGNMLDVSSSYISKISSQMLRDFWGIDGSSKELKSELEKML